MKKLLLVSLLSGALIFSLPINSVMADGGAGKHESKRIKKYYNKAKKNIDYKHKRMNRKRGPLGNLSERNKQIRREKRKKEIAKEKEDGIIETSSDKRREGRKNRVKDKKNKKSKKLNSRNGYGELDKEFGEIDKDFQKYKFYSMPQ